MPTYQVIEYANAIFTHVVDAKSEEEATKLVEMGLVEPKYTDYIEYEVMEVVELKNAK
jgi:hypothetical protein